MKVLCIVNPSSGQDYPILAVLNRFFLKHDIEWDLCVTGKDEFPETSYDYYVIYGGDGTVCEYIEKGAMPALLLHGGTGNIIARDIDIPADPEEALELLLKPNPQRYDAYEVNGITRYSRTFCGPHAEQLSKIERADKDEKGIIAYVEAILKGTEFAPRQFNCILDGKEETIDAYILLVTNFAKLGLGNIKIDQSIDPQDGKLDLVAITSPLLPVKDCRRFTTLEVAHDVPTIWAIDDVFEKVSSMSIKVLPQIMTLLTP